ncbi:malonate transporter, MadL subunit [Malonomonas rubra DSM 5091]|uniref:Malonate transporter, MadL subunit n=2 Tax=Malonomonas rubra TaxID=57040 RepID=A0A1M6NQB2_MALRU|nr:malonate transporter subunit MadL [Malonomonas rubra]AAC45407.1 MadL [Malonomonas rubra]SHJ97931.1 malonate transporter, MadL subunit [Malonomonas rubra DSM 5091]
MVIYGVALLSGCFLVGKVTGSWLGAAIGVKANVGGVGISMLLLVIVCDILIKKGKLKQLSQDGIGFWNAMYIPIVVAMAAKQNVIGAIDGGWLALLAGGVATVVSYFMIPVISKLGQGTKVPAIEEPSS